MSTTTSRVQAMPGPEVLRDPRATHQPRWRAGERLHHLFEHQCDELAAAGRADQVAFEVSDPEGVRRVRYADLDAEANRLARFLVDAGVRPGDRVALLLDEPASSYAAMLAVLKAHAVYVPLDAGYPQDRLAYIISDAGVGLVLTRAGLRPLLGGSAARVVELEEVGPQIDALPEHRLGADELAPPIDDLAYVVYTSGSTGRPKGVAVEHASICNFVRVAAEVYGIGADDRMYQGMTIAFDFSVEEIWVPWMCGATLVPRPPGGSLVGADLHAFLAERQVTAMACVPTLLATIDEDLPGLRFLLVSGEACPRDLVARWWREDRRFLNVYGPTEATVTATWTPLHPERPVTIGVPLPTYTCVVLDPESGQPLPPGATGELGIAGIGLAVGYVNRPDLTATAFVADSLGLPDNPSGRIYRTGDLVRTRPDGEIEYLGRIDLQVKIRGYRIELTEVESVLMQAPGVAQAVVTTHSPLPGVVELAGFVSRRRDVATLDLDAVLSFLRDRLPTYMIPAYLDELAAIPLLPSDKADRKALPAPRGRRAGSANTTVGPRTDTEAALAALLAPALGVDAVSVVDHIFDDLGANSLLMARFCATVRRDPALPVLSMRDVYLQPTVEQLAARCDELAAEQAAEQARQGDDAAGEHTRPGDDDAADARAAPVERRRLRLAVTAFGAAQLAVMLAGAWLVAVLGVSVYRFVTAATGLIDGYLRAVAATAAFTLTTAVLPIAVKWVLIGRWRAGEITLWSPAHLRFWLVTRVERLSPLSVFTGSPLQVLHLRALGAKIGPGVVLMTRDLPVCTDLLTIGAGAVVRQEAHLRGYRPEHGRLRLGRVTIGAGAVVGEKCVLDVDTELGAGARLRPASSLQRGQAVPAGQVWHGSPGRPLDRLRALDPQRAGETWPDGDDAGTPRRGRRARYGTAQLLWSMLGWGPLMIAVVDILLSRLSLDGGNGRMLDGLGPKSLAELASVRFLSALLVASWVLYLLVSSIGFVSSLGISRLFAVGLRSDVWYPMHGWRFALARGIARMSNVPFQMQLFGDSSYILRYLAVLGWSVDREEQTGSNFGSAQKHETPFLVRVGRGTMVSDGLAVLNAEYEAARFRLRQVEIGAHSYLGNDVAFPADARTGADCLFGTKVAVPVDGPVRTGVGLLGSPAFEIPRSVARDSAVGHLREPGERRRRLAAKNRYNLRTMAAFLGLGWARFILVLASAVAGTLLPLNVTGRITVIEVLAGGSALTFSVLVERASLGFRPLQPRFSSIYDRAFWQHERYWKLSLGAAALNAFAGTPMRPLLLRLLGLKVGAAVFDDGCGIPERSLVTIGDRVSLAAGATIQGHSLEEGTFKSDRIVIGSDVVIGPSSWVHYGTTVGDGVVIEADAFLMKGEQVSPGERWLGNPAQLAPDQPKAGSRLSRPMVPATAEVPAPVDAPAEVPAPVDAPAEVPAPADVPADVLLDAPTGPPPETERQEPGPPETGQAAGALAALGIEPVTPFGDEGVHLAVLDLPRPAAALDLAALADAGIPVAVLDQADRDRLEELDDPGQRTISAVCRVLARLCLSAWWHPEVEPQAWRFERTRHGQPVAYWPVGGLHLSVAFTDRVVAVATSAAGPVGVDVQAEPDASTVTAAARTVLTVVERARLHGVPQHGRAQAFLRMCTVKRAVSKALGQESVNDLRSIESSLDPPQARLIRRPDDDLPDSVVPPVVAQWPLTVDGRAHWLCLAVARNHLISW